MDAKLYNIQGKEAGKLSIPDVVFGADWNSELVHQVVISMQGNARTPIAHAKDRSEVSGTGKKPWKQKGTGSARHGSRRSPIWRTGGVAHGPRNERDYSRKINKKMRTKALYAVLSKKFNDGEVMFLDSLSFEQPKTKEAKSVLATLASIQGFDTLATKRANSALIALVGPDDATFKSFRNMGNVELEEVRNLNPALLLQYKYLILTPAPAAVEELAKRGNKENK
jgi:large subunit ribosomal protein L4